MSDPKTKKCPYCAEDIKAEAVKCRYCGSNLDKKNFNFDFLTSPGYWYRENDGKLVAGVCTGIAKQLDAPILILPLRIFFILTTIFWAFGLILYIIMWILMPSKPLSSSAGGKTSSGSLDTHAKKTPSDISSPETEVEDVNFEELSFSDDDKPETPDGGDSKEAATKDEVEISDTEEDAGEKPDNDKKA